MTVERLAQRELFNAKQVVYLKAKTKKQRACRLTDPSSGALKAIKWKVR